MAPAWEMSCEAEYNAAADLPQLAEALVVAQRAGSNVARQKSLQPREEPENHGNSADSYAEQACLRRRRSTHG